MYKNQFIISNLLIKNYNELKVSTFCGLNIYSHPSLILTKINYNNINILLLGYIINPLLPHEGNEVIVKNLARTSITKELLFKNLQLLSGRFILLYKNESDFIALGDTYHLKSLYYGLKVNEIILTSSQKMFLDLIGGKLQISDFIKEFINLKEYTSGDSLWFGEESLDIRLKKLLSNHYLDIVNKKVHRIPIYNEDLVNKKDIFEYSSSILKGSIEAILKRYNVIQAVTAGWDSRVLLE